MTHDDTSVPFVLRNLIRIIGDMGLGWALAAHGDRVIATRGAVSYEIFLNDDGVWAYTGPSGHGTFGSCADIRALLTT